MTLTPDPESTPESRFVALVSGAGSAFLSEATVKMMARAAGLPEDLPTPPIDRELIGIIERASLGRGPGAASRAGARAVLNAGYRKRRVITTLEELKALDIRSVVRTDAGNIFEKLVGGWRTTAVDGYCSTDERWLPATVLYDPSEEN